MKQAKELLEKYKSGDCTTEELALLHRWLHQTNLNTASNLSEEDLLRAKSDFKAHFEVHQNQITTFRLWQKIAAVASIILVISFGIYFIQSSQTEQPLVAKGQEDILPGSNVATLTLADGQKLNLDSIPSGTVMHSNGATVTKSELGQLVYSASSATTGAPTFHLIETPAKGQHCIILPDGSRVWINSLSSLRFPTAFGKDKREVQLWGEAYFEIEKDTHKPFYVVSKGQRIKVLGTHFNVKSYDDEPSAKTTLLEGSVEISYADHTSQRILKPGQQAIVANGQCAIQQVDTDQAVDWKNGDFIFREESLALIMKRVSRWYGVEVAYAPSIDKQQTFSGQVSRSKNLSEVISCLESTGELRFTTKDNKIIITPTNQN